MPTAASALLMRPTSGSISTVNVRPTPIVLTSTGKKTAERMNARPITLEVRSTASSIPSTTFSPEVVTA